MVCSVNNTCGGTQVLDYSAFPNWFCLIMKFNKLYFQNFLYPQYSLKWYVPGFVTWMLSCHQQDFTAGIPTNIMIVPIKHLLLSLAYSRVYLYSYWMIWNFFSDIVSHYDVMLLITYFIDLILQVNISLD